MVQGLVYNTEPGTLRQGDGGAVDAFNFTFSLFAIVLGLSLVEVLSGFARALRRRRIVHLGWLTPLLAIFVMLDLAAYWQWLWSGRRLLSPGYGVLTIGLFVSGLYYLAASIVFPNEFGDNSQEMHGADFDAHYVQHRRQVLGAIMICSLITSTPILVMRFHEVPLRTWVESVIYDGALVAAIVSPRKSLKHRRARAPDRNLRLCCGDELHSAAANVSRNEPMCAMGRKQT